MAEHTIGSVGDFPDGRGTEVEVDGLRVAVFNLDGELYAISGVCPHKQAPLALAGTKKYAPELFADTKDHRGGIDVEERTVSCPWHGLTFEVDTGDCPAASYQLRRFDVRVDGEEVRITV